MRQPVLQDLGSALLQRVIQASDAAARRWVAETADATVANVLYLELPADRLIRLLAPVWIDARVYATVSLLARAHDLSGRDRVALVAAARAIASSIAEAPPQIGEMERGRPYGAVVLRAHDASCAAARRCCAGALPEVSQRPDHWSRRRAGVFTVRSRGSHGVVRLPSGTPSCLLTLEP